MTTSTICFGKNLVAVAIASLAMATAGHAAVVGSATTVDFTGGSTSFAFDRGTFTLSDNMSGFSDPVSVSTAGTAEVRVVFDAPSVDFQAPIVYDEGFIQYAGFPQATVMRFSGTPSSLGLKVTYADGAHFGYALFSGTLLQSYGFETTPNLGILSGAPITAVPEASSVALMFGGLLVVGAAVRRRRESADSCLGRRGQTRSTINAMP